MTRALTSAGVSDRDAENFTNVIFGTADEATFVEMYGRGGIIHEANGPRRHLGMKGLSAFDIRTLKPDGTNWDFRLRSDRRLAMKMVEEQNPDFVIGSPPCTAWCAWNQHLNFKRMDAAKVKQIVDEGRIHLNLFARLYRRQLANGKSFLHE